MHYLVIFWRDGCFIWFFLPTPPIGTRGLRRSAIALFDANLFMKGFVHPTYIGTPWIGKQMLMGFPHL